MSRAAAAAVEQGFDDDGDGPEARFINGRWEGPGREPLPFPPPRAKGRLWEIQGGDLVVRMHPGQTRAYASLKRIVAVIAGSQGGKTSFGPLWLEREIGSCGPGDYLVVTPTAPLSRLKAIPEFLKLFESALKLGKWHKGDRVFVLDPLKAARHYDNPEFAREGADPTRVIFGSAANPESLESATAKAAWLDEVGQRQFRLESWEAVQRRLQLHQGRVLMSTTPYNLGWLYLKIYKRWLDEGQDACPDIEVVQFKSSLNPAFPEEGMVEARRNLPSWRYKLFYEGVFDKPAGLIYGAFQDAHYRFGGHLVGDFRIPPGWPVWVGVDFGGANTATVWVARDPNSGLYFLFHESLSGGRTSAQHVADNRTFEREHGLRVVGWYGGAASEEQSRRDWSQAGLRVLGPPTLRFEDGSTRVLTDVEVGIGRVLSLVEHDRLYVFESCQGVRSQFGSYSRVVLPDGTPSDVIEGKAKYHYLDALRYVSQHLADNFGMLGDMVAVGSVSSAWNNPLAAREGRVPALPPASTRRVPVAALPAPSRPAAAGVRPRLA